MADDPAGASPSSAPIARNVVSRIASKLFDVAMAKLPDGLAVRLIYLRYFGRPPNLRSPQTFNEKLAWRKLYQRDPRFNAFADKVAVKEEVAKIVGKQHIIETLWTGASPEEIPFNILEPPYVVKPSHSSGGNLIVRTPPNARERERIVAFIRKQIERPHGHQFREWCYYSIPRRIMVERMVGAPGNDVPVDYKFFVYDGRVHFIQIDADRFGAHTRNLYDRDWNVLPVKYVYPTSKAIPPPDDLAKMISIAEAIGGQFDFVRVDLYSSGDHIYFGEVTFYPEAGVGTFTPYAWDEKLAEPWVIHDARAMDGSQ